MITLLIFINIKNYQITTQINLSYKLYLFMNMIISVRFINNQTYQKIVL